MISFSNVSKIYSQGGVKAVDSVSFTVPAGSIYGFLGPNGAGKSTTIGMLTGLLVPTEGTVTVDGFDVIRNSMEVKKRIGFVPDELFCYQGMSGREFIQFTGSFYDRFSMDLCDRYASVFELDKAIDSPISSYSHGMKQKTGIIAALSHEPDVLVLDEPMVGLDPQASFELKKIMREYADSGKSVFFSTHVMEVAETVCDRIGIISKGRLLYDGELAGLKRNGETLEETFLSLTRE